LSRKVSGAAPVEHRGLIKSRWAESETGRKRKYYSLKKDGKTAMAKHHE
jgi:PadR family transcriptional regulator, regulatory protein PadR